MKLAKLLELLTFYPSIPEIESLLYECNREGLVKTIIDHRNASLTFEIENQLQSNLLNFGVSLKQVFQKVQTYSKDGSDRISIF
jgi:hypothetical protein